MDGMTGLPSVSLGYDVYAQELAAHGLVLVGNDEDEGQKLLLLRGQAVNLSARYLSITHAFWPCDG